MDTKTSGSNLSEYTQPENSAQFDLGFEGGGSWVCSDASECRAFTDHVDTDARLGVVYKLTHDVPIPGGGTVRMNEYFSLSSWLRSPHKAVLFINGSVFNRLSWSIPVPEYNATDMAARRGLFAYTVDLIGIGDSFKPENGLDITIEANVSMLQHVIEYIRFFRSIKRVDLVGDGYGGILGIHLSVDNEKVNSCVMASMAYKDIVAGPTQIPEFINPIINSPNGYFEITPEPYGAFLMGAPQEVASYIMSTQPGTYPCPGILLALRESPLFDPSVARAPGLVLFGVRDFVVGPEDAQNLANDYGDSGAVLKTCEEAGHAPRTESPQTARWFWDQAFEFIEEQS